MLLKHFYSPDFLSGTHIFKYYLNYYCLFNSQIILILKPIKGLERFPTQQLRAPTTGGFPASTTQWLPALLNSGPRKASALLFMAMDTGHTW